VKVGARFDEQRVCGPEGREWTVGVRWLPRRPTWLGWGPGRTRKKGEPSDLEWLDLAGGCMPDDIPVLGAIVAIIIVLTLIWFAVLPVAVFALDLLFVLILAAAGVATRVLFRRPWIVEASTEGEVRRWPVVGLGSSRAMVGEVVWAIEHGRKLEEL